MKEYMSRTKIANLMGVSRMTIHRYQKYLSLPTRKYSRELEWMTEDEAREWFRKASKMYGMDCDK